MRHTSADGGCTKSIFSTGPCARPHNSLWHANLVSWLRKAMSGVAPPPPSVTKVDMDVDSIDDDDVRTHSSNSSDASDPVDILVGDQTSPLTSADQQPPKPPRAATPSPPSAWKSCQQEQLLHSSTSSSPSCSSASSTSSAGRSPSRASTTTTTTTSRKTRRESHRPHCNYVIGGLNFEVDSRYKVKSIVGKGAYGLVCAAEDSCPSPTSPHGGDPMLLSPASSADASAAAPPPKRTTANPNPTSAAAAAPGAAASRGAPSLVAVKKVIEPFQDHTDCKRLLREVRLLRCLRHPNVLHLIDLMPPPLAKATGASHLSPPGLDGWKDVYLVTRLFDTNLHRVIYSGHALSDAHIQYIVWQIFRALRYLHNAGVVHRDMKPTNLLLNRDCELALADFGLARYMPEHCISTAAPAPAASAVDVGDGYCGAPPPNSASRCSKLTRYVVTRWYRAPELLCQNRTYDEKVDMWSVGCILAEVLGAKALFPGKESLHQLRLILEEFGIPTEEELAAIQNPQAVNYIRNQKASNEACWAPANDAERAAAIHARFTSMYPHASPLLIDLLMQLLQFDPRKRPTAAEALCHPYLAAYKDAPEEGLPTPEIEMDFEVEAPTTQQLQKLLWDEVTKYHPHLEQPQM